MYARIHDTFLNPDGDIWVIWLLWNHLVIQNSHILTNICPTRWALREDIFWLRQDFSDRSRLTVESRWSLERGLTEHAGLESIRFQKATVWSTKLRKFRKFDGFPSLGTIILGHLGPPKPMCQKKKWSDWSPTWPKFRKPVFHSDKLHIISNGRKISEFGFLFSFSRSGSIRLRVRVQNPVILELCFRKMIHLGDQISNNIDPDLENETKNQKSVNFPSLEIMWSLSQWNTGFRNVGQIGDQFDHFFCDTSFLVTRWTNRMSPLQSQILSKLVSFIKISRFCYGVWTRISPRLLDRFSKFQKFSKVHGALFHDVRTVFLSIPGSLFKKLQTVWGNPENRLGHPHY